MSNQNYFSLLGDEENDDPQAVIARAAAPLASEKIAASKKPAAKAITKSAPLPNAKDAPKSIESDTRGGRGGRGGRGARGSGGRGFGGDREGPRFSNNIDSGDSFTSGTLETDKGGRGFGGRGRSGRGGRGPRGRGFYAEGEDRRFRREFDRQPGTGRGHEIKREGAGRGNWGVEGELPIDETIGEEAPPTEETEALPNGEPEIKPAEVDAAEGEVEEKVVEEEEEEKEMTLDEYEKLLEEKRKQLEAEKPELRVVELDKEFESMKVVKKASEDELVFAKLGDKEKKKRAQDEEKRPKAININEFLKPAEGEPYYGPRSSRGRGRGRGGRGGGYGGRANGGYYHQPAGINIDTGDQSQFPTLGA